MRIRHKISAAVVVLMAAAPAIAAADGFFDSAGVKIHYLDRGEGEPVLLIHGYSANARLNWGVSGVTPLLSAKYRVVAIDNRGHGESDKPERVEDYGVNMVEDAVRLLDHLKIEKAHVAGYSMGGMITLKLLTLHPERVKSAVIGGIGWLQPRPLLEERADDGPILGPNKAQAACRRSFPRLSITREELKAIRTPMTVVIGENDQFREPMVIPFSEVRPDVPVVLVPGANHMSCIAKPEFRESIREFIDGRAESDSGP